MGEAWKPLDLRTWTKTGPHIRDLVALHLVGKSNRHRERYIVGTLDVSPMTAELYIMGPEVFENVQNLTRRYHVSWLPLPEDTGNRKELNSSCQSHAAQPTGR